MLGHFCTLLLSMVANPQQRVGELPLLTDAELQQQLLTWNQTQSDFPPVCIHEQFALQVERTPDTVAVVCENQQLTYQELNAKANQLARYLQTCGVGTETLVGLCVERSVQMVVGLLGILKAGAAYVPLDPTYPQERLELMIEDAQVKLLLTQQHLLQKLSIQTSRLICLDSDWEEIDLHSRENPVNSATPENLVYVIYTSGSTGKPKGAMNTHQALSNRLFWMQQTYHLTPADKVLQKTPFSFDVSVWEFFWTLLNGGCLAIAKPEGHKDSAYLVKLIVEQQITIVHFVPSMLQVFLEEVGVEECKCLRLLICSGEALSVKLQKRFFTKFHSTELHNLYGPTEAAIDVTSWACQFDSPLQIVPIGYPISNIQIYILDANCQPLPIGVPGELHIGGVGLARGYLNRPELTNEKFISHPFSQEKDSRLYKTGDLARFLPDGIIDYLGRIDNQVKLRGFRIELGEIEARLNQHPGVQTSIVIVQEDEPNSQKLVAYVVFQSEPTPTITELRKFLRELPSYMIPAAFISLEKLPLTPNGKVDRRALPIPDNTNYHSENTFIPPHNPIEEVLTGIWAEVLSVDAVSIHDNFFELGGHSLLATQVISRIRQTFDINLPLQYLFQSPTVTEFAKAIAEAINTKLGLDVSPIQAIKRNGNLPLSFAQQRLWLQWQLQPDSYVYNIPVAIRLVGDLNIAALETSLNEIICRHEVLRTNFAIVNGQTIQVINPTLRLNLSIVDFKHISKAEREAEAQKLIIRECQQTFDLTQGALLRCTLLELDSQEWIIAIAIHHIAADGWSMGVFVRELAALYTAFCQGKPCPLPGIPIQYADFAVWQQQWLQGEVLLLQLAYWQRQLGDNLPILKLPCDRSGSTVQTFQGARQSLVLSNGLSTELKNLSTKFGVTLFMTLLAGFQTLLHWYTKQEDIVIGTDVANRNQREIEGLIGFFVNQLVLRTDLSGNPTFTELLHRVRQVTLGAYNYQDLPFDKLVEHLNPKRDLSRSLLFQVKFILHNTPIPPLELPDLTLSLVDIDLGIAEFDLLLSVTDTKAGLVATFEYNTDLFEAKTITRLLQELEIVLNAVVKKPDMKLQDITMILTAAQQQLLQIQEEEYQKNVAQKLINVRRKSICSGLT
jgi:amino acid adenylation domain-containing protein